MKRHLFFFLFLILAAGCEKKPVFKEPINVTAFRAEMTTIPQDFEFVGVARSSHQIEVRSRVEGYLTAIDYVEGSMVKKDQLLFEIDHRPFLASLEQAKGELARQEAILWRAQQSFNRIEPLYKQNAASKRDLDDATAAVLAGEASVIMAKAKVYQEELNLSYSYIRSAVDGWSGRAFFREGSLIMPATTGLLTYVDVIDPIWVYFSVADNELLQGRAEGAASTLILPKDHHYTVTLTLADGSTFPQKGTVNFAAPILEPQTATMNVRAQFANPGGVLLPSQFVRANVKGAYRPNAIVIPQASVFQGQAGRYVFVIGKDNTVKMREVQLGSTHGDYWIVNGGLKMGEVIVVKGVNKLVEGSEVKILSTTTYLP